MPKMHMTYIAPPAGADPSAVGIFAVRTYNRDDGQTAKAAGAMWHGPHSEQWPAATCAACKVGLELKEWWYFSPRNVDRAVRLRAIADDAALAHLDQAIARLEVSRSAGTDPVAGEAAQALLERPIPAPPGLVYKPYQKAGIAFMRAAIGGSLLADEPGLGKTIQVLGLINAEGIRRSLIVVPASLRINWLRESVKWLAQPTRIHIVGEKTMAGNVNAGPHRVTAGPDLPADICSGPALVIVNYDRVRDADVLAKLMECQWDLLAADEAHFLKNPKAQRTAAVLGKEVKGKLETQGLRQVSATFVAMTGTPLPNKPVEMWPILHAVSPKTFPNFFGYARRYCNAQNVFISNRIGSRWDFSGASNLAELQDLLRSTCMVRRLKEDVLKELPPKIRQIIALPANDYEDLLEAEENEWEDDEFLADVNAATANVEAAPESAYDQAAALLGDAGKLNFKTVSKTREKLALRKLPAVLEICDNRLEETDKIIIFAHHHSVIKKVLAHYKKEAVAVYGPISAQDRDEAVTRFQNDPSVRVFVGSIAAAGVGLTLTAASTVIFAEVDWVPANMAQAEDRAHRIGQHDVVNVLHIVVERSLDARMVQLLVAKADVADRGLDRITTLAIPEAGADWGAERRARKEAEARQYPRVSPLLVELIREGMQHLTELDADRAQEVNNMGFSKMDGGLGRNLANNPDPTPSLVWNVGVRFAQKYRRQLGNLSDRIADEAARLRAEYQPEARAS